MLSRELLRAVMADADQQSDRIADVPALRGFLAEVTTVQAGAASDGNALVSVTRRDEETTVAGFNANYTPTVGHWVLCLVVDNQPVIVARIVGAP